MRIHIATRRAPSSQHRWARRPSDLVYPWCLYAGYCNDGSADAVTDLGPRVSVRVQQATLSSGLGYVCPPGGSFASSGGQSECTSCGAGRRSSALWTTLRQVQDGNVTVWLVTEAADNATMCGCRSGSCYLDSSSTECVLCGLGLTCPGMGEVTVDVGFYAGSSQDVGGGLFRC